jgi:hypothetical protein
MAPRPADHTARAHSARSETDGGWFESVVA